MGQMSGGPIDFSTFKRGWVKAPKAGTAHYIDRTEGFWPICGAGMTLWKTPTQGYVAFEPGSFPLCNRCHALIAKKK